jgi:hypothetical protein
VQEALQATAVEADNNRIADHHHRRCPSPCRGEQGLKGVWIFSHIVIRKNNAMRGKKRFHVMTGASRR